MRRATLITLMSLFVLVGVASIQADDQRWLNPSEITNTPRTNAINQAKQQQQQAQQAQQQQQLLQQQQQNVPTTTITTPDSSDTSK